MFKMCIDGKTLSENWKRFHFKYAFIKKILDILLKVCMAPSCGYVDKWISHEFSIIKLEYSIYKLSFQN